MAAITICSDFAAQENEICHCFHFLPVCLPWSDGTRCHNLSFLNVEFYASFSLSSITLIKRLFSSYLLSAIRVVSSVYLWLFIFLPAILIPACESSSQTFYMMYSAHKLNKQGGLRAWSLRRWTSREVLECVRDEYKIPYQGSWGKKRKNNYRAKARKRDWKCWLYLRDPWKWLVA